MNRRAFALAICRSIAAAGLVLFATEPGFTATGIKPTSLIVTARPITAFHIGRPEETKFGALEFIGGLELESPNRHFGALSGLAMSPDGSRMIAVTDNGFWFQARLDYDGAERPIAVRDAILTAMRDTRRKAPLIDRGNGDAEALAIDHTTSPPQLLVAFERRHRVMQTTIGPKGIPGRLAAGPKLPKAVSRLKSNKGLEGLAIGPGGNGRIMVAIAERDRDAKADVPGWILAGARTGPFKVARVGRYDVTDATFLPGGDLLVLERLFNLRDGIGMRIRRFAKAAIKPKALLQGTIILEADFSHQIDNMEGLALHRSINGDLIVTIVSDDNRSILQRTLLLQFRYVE